MNTIITPQAIEWQTSPPVCVPNQISVAEMMNYDVGYMGMRKYDWIYGQFHMGGPKLDTGLVLGNHNA